MRAEIRRGGAAMLLGQAGALVAGLLTSVLLVHTIGASGRGVVALLTTATYLLVSILSSGLEGALAREAGTHDPKRASGIAVGWIVTAGIGLALIWGTVGFLARGYWQLAGWKAATLAAFGMLSGMAMSLLRGVLLGRARFVIIGSGRIVFAAVLLGGTAVLAAGDLLTPARAVLVAFAALLGQACLYVGAAGVQNPWLERHSVRRQLSYAWRATAGTLFLSIQHRYDLLLVGVFLTTSAVGVYAVILSLAEICWIPIDVGALIVLGSAAGSRHKVQGAVQATRLILLFAAMGAAIVAAVGPFILGKVFGEPFLDAYPILLVALPGTVLLAPWRFCMNDAAGRGHPEIQARSAVIGAGLAVVLDLALIPLWGLYGAALGSTVSYGASLVLGFRGYARVFSIPSRDLWTTNRADVGLLLAWVRSS